MRYYRSENVIFELKNWIEIPDRLPENQQFRAYRSARSQKNKYV